MKSKRDLLVTLADRNYIQQSKQLFSSVYWNAGWTGDYMLLSHEIPEEDLKWFRDKGILVKECKPLDNKSITYVYPPVVLDKFYLFTEEFKAWETIVFLDSDIIVKAPIDGLTKIKSLGAAQDLYFNKLHTQLYNPGKNCFNNKVYDLNIPAYNTGVFAFNTRIIKPETFDELDHFFKDNVAEFKYLDQATLNLVFYKQWEKLPKIYNIFYVYPHFWLPRILKYPIIHFVKCPEHPLLWDIKNPFYAEWKKNLERAELMNLGEIQKVKKWGACKINLFSFLFTVHLHIYLAPYRLKHIFFIYDIQSFFKFRIQYFFAEAIKTPNRLIGKLGARIQKYSPNLYKKLRK
ncbi:MAG TPA: glycosyltransferase [Bacteroidales bacterium]|nr:glycosyltransferase [Bacteroidales bacterium]